MRSVSREWKLFFLDMVEFCQRIQSYTAELERSAFEASNLYFDATVRNIELIGEAARNIPEEIRRQMPDIPWPKLVGIRNVLAHGYFSTDKDVVWDLIRHAVPVLLAQLQSHRARIERGEIR